MATAKKESKGKSDDLVVSGRFPAGSEVTVTKASGPEQMLPGLGDEVVATETVDKDGNLSISGTEPGERYFASGYVNGQPYHLRLTGHDDNVQAHVSGYEGVPADRGRRGDGTFVDEPSRAEQAEAEAKDDDKK